jgi:hypothetical protein
MGGETAVLASEVVSLLQCFDTTPLLVDCCRHALRVQMYNNKHHRADVSSNCSTSLKLFEFFVTPVIVSN